MSKNMITNPIYKVIAWVFFLFPLVYLPVVHLAFDVRLERLLSLLISPFFYLVCAVTVTAGAGLRRFKSWSWYVRGVALPLVFYESLRILVDYSSSPYRLELFGGTTLLLLSMFYFVSRELRVPYRMPRIRWWETNPKFRWDLPTVLQNEAGVEKAGTIMDITSKGCFVSTDGVLVPEEKIYVTIPDPTPGEEEELRIQGRVIWVAQPSVTYPRGAGIRFEKMDRHSRKGVSSLKRKVQRRISLMDETQVGS